MPIVEGGFLLGLALGGTRCRAVKLGAMHSVVVVEAMARSIHRHLPMRRRMARPIPPVNVLDGDSDNKQSPLGHANCRGGFLIGPDAGQELARCRRRAGKS